MFSGFCVSFVFGVVGCYLALFMMLLLVIMFGASGNYCQFWFSLSAPAVSIVCSWHVCLLLGPLMFYVSQIIVVVVGLKSDYV